MIKLLKYIKGSAIICDILAMKENLLGIIVIKAFVMEEKANEIFKMHPIE